jgi:hypothetical protein
MSLETVGLDAHHHGIDLYLRGFDIHNNHHGLFS